MSHVMDINSSMWLIFARMSAVPLHAATSYYERVFSNATLEEKKVIVTFNNLPLKMIAPGHGVILKDFLPDIVNYYMENIK